MTTDSDPVSAQVPSRGDTHDGRRGLFGLVLLTSIAIAVFAPLQYLGGDLAELGAGGNRVAANYAQRSALIQAVLYIHIVTAGVALVVGGAQFSHRLRTRFPLAHRYSGRLYAVAALLGGASGLVVACTSAAGLTGLIGFGALAVGWMWSTASGWASARSGRIADHRAWMIRSFALAYAAVTLRVWLLVTIPLLGGFDTAGDNFARAYAPVPFLCWIPNLIVAETLIARRNLPGLRP
ncbi:DUF2306 domain-containing protein, partial [Gordonia amarae]